MRNKKYKKIKARNSRVRKVLPNPLGSLKKFGILGWAASIIGKKAIGKPVHKVARCVTGTMYRKGVDDPSKGSDIYTIIYIIILILIALGTSFAVNNYNSLIALVVNILK